ncbi:MAG: hypothetical protein AAF961_13250 [Planctomycetota bacterium]
MPWLIPLTIPLLLPTLWRKLMSWFATLSGWSRLAEQYPAGETPEGPTFRRQSIKVGRVSFNHCAIVIVTEEAVYIALQHIYGTMHPPLLIPWSEFHHVREEGGLRKRFAADVGLPFGTPISLPLEAVRQKPGAPLANS